MAITYSNPGRAEQMGSLRVGRVLKVYNRDYRAMSDVYTYALFALVWDDASAAPLEIMVNACFECDVSGGHAEIDADEATLAAYEQYNARVQQRAQEARKLALAEEAEKQRNRPEKGKRMRVARGRKVAPGTEGTVFWIRDGRVGLDVTGKRDVKGHVVDPVWVSADYLVAV